MAVITPTLSLIDSEGGVLPLGSYEMARDQSYGIPVVIGGVVRDLTPHGWASIGLRVTSNVNGRLMICECLFDISTAPV